MNSSHVMVVINVYTREELTGCGFVAMTWNRLNEVRIIRQLRHEPFHFLLEEIPFPSRQEIFSTGRF